MNIKKTVNELMKMYNTRNPYELIDYLDILMQKSNLGKYAGYYIEYDRVPCICINSQLRDDKFSEIIAAHELGHAILHRGTECMFFPDTLYSLEKTETQANIFAAELLIPDYIIVENEGLTKEQIAKKIGYNARLLDFKKFNINGEKI